MTAEHLVTVYGTTVMVCAPDGVEIDGDGAVNELVGEALGLRAQVVVLPTERLTDDFFDLSTGTAADVTQRFATYDVRVAVVGDIAERLAADAALADWVAESNSATQLWFCPTFEDFQARLDRRKTPR